MYLFYDMCKMFVIDEIIFLKILCVCGYVYRGMCL